MKARGLIMDGIYSSFIADRSHSLPELFDMLPEVVILCRENAIELLGVAFDAGCRCTLTLPPLTPTNTAAGPKPSARTEDLADLLSRSLWLLSGLSQSHGLLETPISTS